MDLRRRLVIAATGIAVFAAATAAIAPSSPGSSAKASRASQQHPNQVLEWNQIFIETLTTTSTPNSSSQRLGAIVHTAIFDAFNGIERRYTPIFVQNVDGNGESSVPPGASRRAAVVAAAYTALVGLFPARATQLGESYEPRSRRSATTAETADVTGARHCLGHTCRSSRARLALRRRLRRDLPGVRRRNRGRSLAADSARHGDERPGVGIHCAVRRRKQYAVPAGTPARSRERYVRGGLRRREGARAQNGVDAYRVSDGARTVLGGQRERPLESGCQPDCARRTSVDVQEQSAARRSQRRPGRHGVDDLEREAALRRRSGRGDLAAAYGDHPRGHGRNRGNRGGSRTGSRSSPPRRTRNIRRATRPSTAPPRPSY